MQDELVVDGKTRVIFGDEARRGMLEGMRVVADAVGSTLGPRGMTVVISKKGSSPIVTKDGVTVSKSINPTDPVQSVGAELIKQVASQVAEGAGDGTTTATVLTHVIARDVNRLLSGGCNPVELRAGMNEACGHVVRYLEESARQLSSRDDVAMVARISANGDRMIGDAVAAAFNAVGEDGVIAVEEALGMETSLHVVEGLQFDRGYVSPYFVTDSQRMVAHYEDALVLVCADKISDMQELLPVLEQVLREGRPLLIVADDVEGSALHTLIVNKTRPESSLKVVAVRAPGSGGRTRLEQLEDIAVLTGAKIVSRATNVTLSTLSTADLGKCKQVTCDGKSTTIVATGATALAVKERVDGLRAQAADPTISRFELDHLRLRISRLASGAAVIKVGGATEAEMIERKHRVEDALCAARAASELGILPGGGTALIRAAQAAGEELRATAALSDDARAGAQVVLRACEAPLAKMASNAGKAPDVVVDRVKSHPKHDFGYDFVLDDVVDMFEAAVVDPAKVTITALEDAVSIGGVFVRLDAVVVPVNEN